MRFAVSDTAIDAEIERLVVAGWTGRDRAAVEHHIEELAGIGVPPPSRAPLFYRVSRSLLIQAPVIEVLGEDSSGEVEPLLVNREGELLLGLGSDHTDRKLETVSIAASKQACPKPVSKELWRFDEVASHLDDLILRCEIEENGTWILYQEGTLASILPLLDLADSFGFGDRCAMLCGTVAALGGIRPARAYRMELADVSLRRSLHLEYRVRPMQVVE